MFVIRSATATDVSDLVRLHLDTVLVAYSAYFPPEAVEPSPDVLAGLWQRDLETAHDVVVAVDEATGDIVGSAVARRDGDLARLHVHPRRWRHGIGRRLHDAAVEALWAAGYEELRLWVIEGNGPARTLYERAGWRLVPGETLTELGITEVRYALSPALRIRDLTPDEAGRVAAWRYPPPFDIYDGDPGDDGASLLARSAEGYGYYGVVDHGDEVVGFCCYGPEARVRGQAEEHGTLDVGGGVRPDLVSQGVATKVFPAVLRFGAQRWAPARFRTAVASFNERSRRLCTSAGFEVVRTFEGPGRDFDELVRNA